MKSSLRIVAGLLASASFATIAQAGEIAGSVSDATGARALQSASVRIVELGRAVETDRAGRYVFGDVPAGTYTVEVRYVGAEAETRTITVPATGTADGSFALNGIGGGDILVIGQAANLASSLSRQKAADGVESVLTRDAIGHFPDQNVAESLRRLPGVNILNDQGEGRFVSVRGLSQQLNSTSLNGVRVPAPESDVRSVALDVISSDTIESIEVKKSFTPDMDGDFIGASVEIKTTSAFDRKKDYYGLRAEGSYNDYSGKVTPKGTFDFSKRLGEDFGVAGSVSYYLRKFETDNIEAEDWGGDDDATYAEKVEYRDYDVERERINAALNFDWRVADSTTAFLRGSWSQFDDQEYRRRTVFDFGDAIDVAGTAKGVRIRDTYDEEEDEGAITVERDLKDRFERQRITTVALGSDTDTGTWKFNWLASWAKASEKESGSIDPIAFASKFEGDGVAIDWDFSDRRVPLYSVSSGAGLVNDPDNYEFDKAEITTLSDSKDEEFALKADLARTFAMGTGALTLQAGAKQRWRKKSYNSTITVYEPGDEDYVMTPYLGEQTYRLNGISLGPVLRKSAGKAFMDANRDDLEVNLYDSGVDSAADDYSVKEDITAAYALARWDSDAVRVIGGVRMERTRDTIRGFVVTEDEDREDENLSPLIAPVSFRNSYTTWLPSLTVRWAPQDNIVARLAGYKTLVRPKFSELAPRATVEDDEITVGNPDLKPYEAWNLDAALEYYLPGNGALSVSAFYKSVKNFTFEQTFQDFAYNGVTYDEGTTFLNGDKADIVGVEASYSQAYTMLPAPFDGLLTQINYTYTYARGDADGRRVFLPESSRHTINAVLGYEKGPVDLRLAGTYRDKYLDELGGEAEEDRWVDNHFQLDFSGRLKVTEYLRLTVDVININNAKYFAYQNLAGAQRLLQFEKYGPTVKFGARMNF